MNVNITLTIEQLIDEFFAPHWQDETWHQVLRLISKSIKVNFLPRIVNYLLEQEISRNNCYDEDMHLVKEGFSNLILATNCFLEVENKHEIPEVADQLISVLKHEIELSENRDKLDNEAALTLTLLLATLGKDHSDIFLWLKEFREVHIYTPEGKRMLGSQSFVSSSVVRAISQVWQDDPTTWSWIKERLDNGESDYVKCAAIEAITQDWHDHPETLPLLKENIRHNPSWGIRSSAMRALIKGFQDDPETLPLLKESLQNDNGDVMKLFYLLQVVKLIAENWHDHPETLPWLTEMTKPNEEISIRRTAIEAIAQGWKNEPQVFDFLCHIARHDPYRKQSEHDKTARRSALEAVLINYSDRPEVLGLLRDLYAMYPSDLDDSMNEFAEEKLANWTKKSPELDN
jgi:hypothetical protein